MKTNAFALLFAGAASAHTIFQRVGVNGAMEERYKYMRLPTYDGPIQDVTSSSMTCNGPPNDIVMVSDAVLDVPAGADFTLQWAHTLDTDFQTGMIIDESHHGPVMVYMAKVADATGSAPQSGWFKIYEDGYDSGVWAVDKLIDNEGKVTVKIPECIEEGDYLLRGELIALHAASNYPGAQFYMECAQIHVTNGGSAAPQTYSIPGIYSGSDPGVKFNLWGQFSSYEIPGPDTFTC
ncbi:glycoside hydrolase [Lineolata rhizophorae]|uniref:AA9 family lytic polysaccharide monooxygenase n=1 Tax=Lineolata rhizophorae TaxID=578093 RepID=A0A6A6NW21_9PEZI|nr:glycoside hydrolase [Lineolata rhizophorae]